MNCGSGVDFVFGQSSGPEGGTVNPPFLVRTGIWMVESNATAHLESFSGLSLSRGDLYFVRTGGALCLGPSSSVG